MRLKITLQTKTLTLFLPYYSYLQGAIYSNLPPDLFDLIHNRGFPSCMAPKKILRFFNFSKIFAEKHFVTRLKNSDQLLITFFDNIHFFVASPVKGFIEELSKNLQKGLVLKNILIPVTCKMVPFPEELTVGGRGKIEVFIKVEDLFIATRNGVAKQKQEYDFFTSDFDRALETGVEEKVLTAYAYNLLQKLPAPPFFKILAKTLHKTTVLRLRKGQETFKTYTCTLLVRTYPEILYFLWSTGLGARTSHGLGFISTFSILTTKQRKARSLIYI